MDLKIDFNQFDRKLIEFYSEAKNQPDLLHKQSQLENIAKGKFLSFEKEKASQFLTEETAKLLITQYVINSIQNLPKTDSKYMLNDSTTIEITNLDDPWHSLQLHQIIPEVPEPQWIGWMNLTNELGYVFAGEGSATIYTHQKNIREIKKIFQIKENESFWKKDSTGKYLKAKCKYNKNWVKTKQGTIRTAEKDFERRKRASTSFELERISEDDPIIGRFTEMKYYLKSEGEQAIQSTRNLSPATFFFSDQYPKSNPTKKEHFNIFKENFPKLGLEVTSKDPIEYGLKLAYKITFKIK